MKKIYITTLLIIFIVIVVNLLSTEFHFRLDLTNDSQYTLNSATRDILDELEEPVTIKAYFSENLPAMFLKSKRDFQELLIEYSARSNGLVQYEFINPGASEALENEAMQAGIQPRIVSVREKDQAKQQKAFMGAIITLGNKQEVLPLIVPNYPIEYGLSTAIKKISIDNKPAVGFLQGNGEPNLMEMQQLMEQLSVMYTPTPVSITDTTSIPSDLKALVVVRPTDSLSEKQFAQLDAFLAQGKGIVVALNRVDGNLQTSQGTPLNTGLETWLTRKGITVEPNFVVDAKCASVTMQQQTPFGMMQTQLPFPYLPVVARFADHPITKGLEAVLLTFASEVKFFGDTTVRFTPLMVSSEQSNVEAAPIFFNVQKQWTEAELPVNGITLAGTLEGKLSGSMKSKMVVIGDGDFPVNGSGEQAQRVTPDNVNILSNAIDWLADDTGLNELRTKGAVSRPIKEMEEGSRAIVKYTNFLLPLVLVMIYGLVRFQRNRIRRLKRMSENYEED